jgi:hypothetical protein
MSLKIRKPRDKYSKAIRHLRAHPEELGYAWFNPREHKAGCLFAFLKPTRNEIGGCPVMLRSGWSFGANRTPEQLAMLEAVKKDDRIPRVYSRVRIEHLKFFAYHQRQCDKVMTRDL